MTKKKDPTPKYKQSETVVVKRSQINFAPYNPRKEDPDVVKKLKKNFKTVGYLGGIVWNRASSYLVSGHKRVQTLDIINNYDGTPETDMNIYGIAIAEEHISAGTASIVDDFEEMSRPYEERKAAVKEMKAQIRQQAEQKAEDIESYVMVNFKTYRAKSSFMLRFGYSPDAKIIEGEAFADMVERVE